MNEPNSQTHADASSWSHDSTTSLDVMQKRLLHELCWEFEVAIRSGEPVNLEHWLNRRGGLSRDLVLAELLAIELEVRYDADPDVDVPSLTDETMTLDVDETNIIQTDVDETENAFLKDCLDRMPNDGEVIHQVMQRAKLERCQRLAQSQFAHTNQRYEFIHELARGGTGAVWRVYDRHLHRQTAVKVLLDSHNNAEMRRRLEQEARLCGRMQHPGIVPIHELDHFENGTPFVSMKLIEGQTLAQLLQSETEKDQTKLIRIFLDVCEALAYAHQQGIIHRDLKPQNIMVGAFNEVQLMDWGLGKSLSTVSPAAPVSDGDTVVISNCDQTHVGSVFGTLAYMAPEQARGEVSQVDRRSDVFSLGGILCCILTGAPIYDVDSHTQMHLRACNGSVEGAVARLAACDADRRLRQLAIRCIAIRPEDRPADAGEVAAQLRAILMPRKSRGRFMIATAVASLALIVVAYSTNLSARLWAPADSTDHALVLNSSVAKSSIAKSSLTQQKPFGTPQSDSFERLEIATRCFKNKEYPECERLLREILNDDPYFVPAHLALIQVLRASEKPVDAANAANDAWQMFPHDRQVREAFVNGLFDERRPDVLETWKDVLKSQPDDVPLHLDIAWQLFIRKQLSDAETIYRTALKLDPNFFLGYYGLGMVLLEQKRYDESIVCFNRSLELTGDNPGWREDSQRMLDFAQTAATKHLQTSTSPSTLPKSVSPAGGLNR